MTTEVRVTKCTDCGTLVIIGMKGWREQLVIQKPLEALYACPNASTEENKSMRMKTVLRPNMPRGAVIGESDYWLVPAVTTYGEWKVREMLSDWEMGRLARMVRVMSWII